MISNELTVILLEAETALRAAGGKVNLALADRLHSHAISAATARSAMSAAATRRGGQGRPKAIFNIELTPGGTEAIAGGRETTERVNEILTLHKARTVSQSSIQVAISKAGAWWRVVETDNGTLTLSVNRTVGIDLAVSKTRAKNPKSALG